MESCLRKLDDGHVLWNPSMTQLVTGIASACRVEDRVCIFQCSDLQPRVEGSTSQCTGVEGFATEARFLFR